MKHTLIQKNYINRKNTCWLKFYICLLIKNTVTTKQSLILLLLVTAFLPFSAALWWPLITSTFSTPRSRFTLPNLASNSRVLLEQHSGHDFHLDKALSLVEPAALECSALAAEASYFPQSFTFSLIMGNSQSLLPGALVFVLCTQDPWRDPPTSFREASVSVLLTLTPTAPFNLTLSFWAFGITPLGCHQLSLLALCA